MKFQYKPVYLLFVSVLLTSLLLTACQPAAAPAPTAQPAPVEVQPTDAPAAPAAPAATEAPTAEPVVELSPVRYGGQLYPEEYLLKGVPALFTDAGLQVEHTLFSSATEGNQALISGAVDINVASDSKTVALFSAMPDQVVIIGVVQRGDRYSTLVRPDSSYTSWYDLKGKQVGIRMGTGAEQVVRRYFEKVGDLKWEDFQWVNLKVEDSIAALTSGSIEAFTAWEPTPAIAEAQGAGKVMMSYGDIALTPVLLNTTVKYAESHRAEIVHFLAAHLAKAEMIKSDPKKSAELAAQAASAQGATVDPAAFEKIFTRVDFSLDLDETVIAALQDTANFLVSTGEIKEVPTLKWDASYLEEARKLVEGN